MLEPRRAFTALVGLHLRELRGQFVALVIFTLALPLAFAAALNALTTLTPSFMPGSQAAVVDPVAASERASLILVPTLVMALLGVAWVVLPQQLARMRATQQFGFFAGFAVGRVTYLLALLATYAIAALPGLLVVPAVVAIALRVPLSLSPVLIIVVPLVFVALAATGGALGLARLGEGALTALSTALYAVALGGLWLLAAGLGGTFHTLVLLIPAALAADLLTATLPHLGTSAVTLDVLGLILYAAGGGYLVYRLLPWRVGTTQPQVGS